MKISQLTNGLLVSLLLSASVAEAGDSKYPATDFQPKVVYQDTDYKHTSSAPSSSTSSKSKAEVSVADSNYPAANFQPEVLYEDKDYKHSKGNVSASSSSSTTSSSSSVEASGSDVQAESDDSSLSLVMGLVILAVAGFVFYSKNNKITKGTKKVKSSAPAKRAVKKAAISSGEAVSGVDKYLESKGGVEPSSVEKYLEDRNSSVSGVAKYVAKQKVSARIASVTGVEKYLKDKG